MDAKSRQLNSIFDPNVFFQVPLFQRPYVWKEEENWEPLWEDIVALLDRQLRGVAMRPHFLGAVVLEQLRNPTGSVQSRLVIDGQQRFTTLQLFLLAGRNLSNAHGNATFAGRFTGFVENSASLVEDPNEKYKLWPTNSDRPAFKAIHASGSLQELAKAVKAKPNLGNSSLVGAYRYFHTHLAEWLDGKLDDENDAKVLGAKTINDRLDALWRVVVGGLTLVVINLDEEDDTQVIFETLNARGTELLPADLIKNYLFRKALAQGADVESLYDNHWSRFETKFWREEIKQGRNYRPRIDLFINHYLTLISRDEVKTSHLFNAFKEFVEHAKVIAGSKIPVPVDAAGHIEQLARYADVFEKFFEPGDHPVLIRFLDRLSAVDTATVYPFLLHAYAELMPDDQAEFDKVVGVLESFLMRRLITNYTPKNYNRLFVDLIKAVEKAGSVSAAAVAEQLGKGTGDSSKFPTDQEVLTTVFELPLYGRIAQFKVRAVLEALELALQSSKSPTLNLTEKLTIEHVMPQTWRTFWPLPDDAKTDALVEQKASAKREIILNTLGNLTLITGAFNSSLQNAAWSSKGPELRKYGKLNLTQYFHGDAAEDWNEEAILTRTKYLFEKLLKIWPDITPIGASPVV